VSGSLRVGRDLRARDFNHPAGAVVLCVATGFRDGELHRRHAVCRARSRRIKPWGRCLRSTRAARAGYQPVPPAVAGGRACSVCCRRPGSPSIGPWAADLLADLCCRSASPTDMGPAGPKALVGPGRASPGRRPIRFVTSSSRLIYGRARLAYRRAAGGRSSGVADRRAAWAMVAGLFSWSV